MFISNSYVLVVNCLQDNKGFGNLFMMSGPQQVLRALILIQASGPTRDQWTKCQINNISFKSLSVFNCSPNWPFVCLSPY